MVDPEVIDNRSECREQEVKTTLNITGKEEPKSGRDQVAKYLDSNFFDAVHFRTFYKKNQSISSRNGGSRVLPVDEFRHHPGFGMSSPGKTKKGLQALSAEVSAQAWGSRENHLDKGTCL